MQALLATCTGRSSADLSEGRHHVPCRTSGRANFVTEGKATISLSGNDVFYNKAQVVNRDISVAVLRWFVKVLQAEGPSKKNARVKPPKNAVFNRKVRIMRFVSERVRHCARW